MTRVLPGGGPAREAPAGARRPPPERMPVNLDAAAGRLYTQRL